jgi:ABC-type taurine transport system ATPase subunit
LDLLGLGIRVGLTKVFVPGADMLVLDEPFSACSADRTQACLAFAAGAGFGQTIVITHESGTEEVFDNIVEV